jgi:hypothetical protein
VDKKIYTCWHYTVDSPDLWVAINKDKCRIYGFSISFSLVLGSKSLRPEMNWSLVAYCEDGDIMWLLIEWNK